MSCITALLIGCRQYAILTCLSVAFTSRCSVQALRRASPSLSIPIIGSIFFTFTEQSCFAGARLAALAARVEYIKYTPLASHLQNPPCFAILLLIPTCLERVATCFAGARLAALAARVEYISPPPTLIPACLAFPFYSQMFGVFSISSALGKSGKKSNPVASSILSTAVTKVFNLLFVALFGMIKAVIRYGSLMSSIIL